eukprot:TRINITY_DN8654_c0_g1_i1.p1 TRINITY_DN8654_c0_g1~~TRINITY_DN8654_c0_g1_i1.p1  ORF type:complete len:197 (-),score=43.56 TRINITY_DN8654_c0_g1_i1:104-694(-)
MKIAVLGGGSFATALAFVFSKNCDEIVMLSRNPDVCRSINEDHRNSKYLKEFTLPQNIRATSDASDAFRNVNFIVHSIPVQASFEYLANLSTQIPSDVPIISSSKGLHATTLELMSDIIPKALGRNHPTAFVSGPSFAKELMNSCHTAIVVASVSEKIRDDVIKLMVSPSLRVYPTSDVIGVEVGGALKNVLASGG